jgi:predicted outer membrane repeat protein
MTTTTATPPRTCRALGLLASLCPLLLLTLLFWPGVPAQATNNVVVGTGNPASCNMTALGMAMNNNTDASISFNCGGPATISLTQSFGLNVVNGKRFTISGGDIITFTGLDGNRLFWVQTGGALTLTHVTLVHGNDNNGGAVLNDSAYLALDHVTVSHNHASSGGGAIEDSGGTTRLTNSTFVDNSASTGGAVRSLGTLSLTNTNLISNSASDIGGALYVAGPASITSGQVSGNSANHSGGGLYVAAASQLTVDGVLFDHNHTVTATIATLYTGGAIKSGGVLTVTNSRFTSNASVYGGAIYHDGGNATLTDDSLSGNMAQYGGGFSNSGASSYTNFYRTVVLQNTAGVLGGGIYGEKGIFGLRQTSGLTGNTAQAGGGLYAKIGSNFLLVDSSISNNHATNANGGGLYIETGSVGGASNVTFQGNQAEGTGGAIDNEADSFSVIGSLLTGNSAIYGAGLYNAGKNVLLGSSNVQGNTGSYGVGVENAASGSINVYATTIAANAGIIGGGLKNEAGGNMQVFQTTISANSAEYGAGVSNDVSGTLYLGNSTLSGNTASAYGGGLDTAGDVTLQNATVSGNSAVTGGGLNIEIGARVVISNSILAYSLDGGNCVGSFTAARHNVSSDNTCGFSGLINGHDPNHLDPLLTALGNYGGLTLVHMLKHNSPVLDALDSSDEPGTDQRGLPRPKGLGFDPGAVERQPGDSDLAPWLWLPLIRR